MRILYGVVGEGMGHAIRSRVVLERLAARHDVHVVVSGRAHDYLSQHLAAAAEPGEGRASVHRIWGLSIVHAEGAAAPAATALQNLKGALTGLPRNVAKYFEIASEFDPEVVVSDYESWSYLFGKANGIPVISLDNIQAVSRCVHPPEIVAGHEATYRLARAFTGSKLAGCAHYLVTTFFHPELRKERTTLVPPILREEILAARASRRRGEHLLVYQTAAGDERISEALRAAGIECRIYGLRRDL
ncbi:MAG: glycosyltransferase family protein, partial [Planctomycetota bacterium]